MPITSALITGAITARTLAEEGLDVATTIDQALEQILPIIAELAKIYHLPPLYGIQGISFKSALTVSSCIARRVAQEAHHPAFAAEWARHYETVLETVYLDARYLTGSV